MVKRLSKNEIEFIEMAAHKYDKMLPIKFFLKLYTYPKRDKKKEPKAKHIGTSHNSHLKAWFREYATDDGLGIVIRIDEFGEASLSYNGDLSKEIVKKLQGINTTPSDPSLSFDERLNQVKSEGFKDE